MQNCFKHVKTFYEFQQLNSANFALRTNIFYFTHTKTQTANMANHLAQANGRVKTRSINFL